jgi:hypothetical protein
MAEINNAIALQAAPQAYNPLETVGKVSQVQQLLLNNKLLQQKYGSAISGGRAIAGAIDPETGLPDPAKVGQYFVDHPDEAQYGAEAIEKAQGLRTGQLGNLKTQTELSADQLKLSQQRWGVAAGVMDGLLSKQGPVTPDDVVAAVKTQMIPLGHFNDKDSISQVVNFVQGLPQPTGNPVADDKATRAYLQQWSIQANNALEHVNTLLGSPQTVDTGSKIVSQQVSPLTGEQRINGGLVKGLTPEAGAELVDLVNPATGEHVKVPKASLIGGAAPPAPGGAGGGDGRYPGARAGAGGVPGAVGVSALAPGAPEAMAESYKTFQADQQAVPDLRKVLTTFDQAYAAIKQAKTGPGSEWLQNLRGIADTYGAPLPPGVSNKDQTVAYAEANKWLTSALTSEAHRLGLGTDQARALQQEAQPGVKTVRDAAIAMIPILKGLKAMDVAAPLLAQKEGVSPQQYVQWRANWANSVDPLAFGAPLMPASQRKALIDKMSPDEKARYIKGIKSAVNAGLFTYDDLKGG